MIEAVDLAERLEDADLCLTGEGALDDQSAFGKTAVGVARLARFARLPDARPRRLDRPRRRGVLEQGLDAYFSICPGPISLDEAMARAASCWNRRRRRPCGGSWREAQAR